MIRPADHQPRLPTERFLLDERPGDEATPLDVLFVGGGPAGLAGAIELARLSRQAAERGEGPGELEIGVLEKAESLGEHCLSGAVVDPAPLRQLFPDVAEDDLPLRRPVERDRVYLLTERRSFRLPTPPEMRNHGKRVASLCEIVRWMGERAEELGVHLFTGFPAAALFVEDDRVVGARTTAGGLDREGRPGAAYTPPNDLTAKVTVLADGTRSPLAQAYCDWQQIGCANPQLYALGVKELWETKRAPEAVIHTLGWPLPRDAFGGSWLYPMGDGLVSLGLVVGLDYRQSDLDVHVLLQRLKGHPLFRAHLEGGEMLEWGAKTIPEGGFHSVAERLHGDGLIIVGDAAGLVNVAALKGIHLAMHSGVLAARTIFDALRKGTSSREALAAYDAALRESFVFDDLRRTRNMRLAFKSGFWLGGLKAALMSLTRGAFPGRRIPVWSDAREPKDAYLGGEFRPEGSYTFAKLDAVYRSGNATRDDIPSHLLVGEGVNEAVAEFYGHLCPAGVYERGEGGLVVNAPNCVDCRATDVLGPRWMPREGGSGPRYKRM